MRERHIVATSLPTGVTAPMPVTTTLRFMLRGDLAVQISERISNCTKLLGVFIWDVDVELLLELHHQLDDVKAVRTEILDEARLVGQLLALDSELLLDDVLNLLRVVGHVAGLRCV